MKYFIFRVLPIIIPIIGIATTLYLDHFKERRSLSLYMKSQHSVIKNDTSLVGIDLTYNGETIRELYSTRFLFKNSGNRFIEKADVIKPITVKLGVNKLLDVKEHRSMPEDIGLSVKKSENNSLLFDFELLNPGDEYEFDTLTTSPVTYFEESQRIKGLVEFKRLHYVENPPLKDRVTNSQIYSFFFSLVLTVLFWIVARVLVGPVRATAYYIKDELPVEGFEEELFMGFINNSTKNRLDDATLEKIRARLKKTDINDDESLSKFRDETCYDVLNRDPSGSMALILLFMVGWVIVNAWSIISSVVNV